jgi:hypothetical protein
MSYSKKHNAWNATDEEVSPEYIIDDDGITAWAHPDGLHKKLDNWRSDK